MPKEHWSIPSWIDEEKAKKVREEMDAKNIIYGGSLSYRHMCRFQSGFFFRQPLLSEYDWYWRVVCTPISMVLTLRNRGRIIIAISNMMCLSSWRRIITNTGLPCPCRSIMKQLKLYGTKQRCRFP